MTGLPAKATGPPLGMSRNQIIRELKSVEAELAAERERSERLERALQRIADDDCGSWDQAMRFARERLASLSTSPARPVGGQE